MPDTGPTSAAALLSLDLPLAQSSSHVPPAPLWCRSFHFCPPHVSTRSSHPRRERCPVATVHFLRGLASQPDISAKPGTHCSTWWWVAWVSPKNSAPALHLCSKSQLISTSCSAGVDLALRLLHRSTACFRPSLPPPCLHSTCVALVGSRSTRAAKSASLRCSARGSINPEQNGAHVFLNVRARRYIYTVSASPLHGTRSTPKRISPILIVASNINLRGSARNLFTSSSANSFREIHSSTPPVHSCSAGTDKFEMASTSARTASSPRLLPEVPPQAQDAASVRTCVAALAASTEKGLGGRVRGGELPTLGTVQGAC